jgi:hypothetical protein
MLKQLANEAAIVADEMGLALCRAHRRVYLLCNPLAGVLRRGAIAILSGDPFVHRDSFMSSDCAAFKSGQAVRNAATLFPKRTGCGLRSSAAQSDPLMLPNPCAALPAVRYGRKVAYHYLKLRDPTLTPSRKLR